MVRFQSPRCGTFLSCVKFRMEAKEGFGFSTLSDEDLSFSRNYSRLSILSSFYYFLIRNFYSRLAYKPLSSRFTCFNKAYYELINQFGSIIFLTGDLSILHLKQTLSLLDIIFSFGQFQRGMVCTYAFQTQVQSFLYQLTSNGKDFCSAFTTLKNDILRSLNKLLAS